MIHYDIEKAAMLINRLFHDIYVYGKDHYAEVPEELYVSLDERHLLLAYQAEGNPVNIKITNCEPKITFAGIPVITKENYKYL